MIEAKLSVEDRLTRIENMLEKISMGIGQAPTMMAMATDSFDELIINKKREGINIEDSFENAFHLLSRLATPNISAMLEKLLDTMEQGPGLISIALDSVDESLRNANQGSTRLDERMNSVVHLLTQLTEPKMINQLNGLIKLADQSSGLVAMGMDTIDEFIDKSKILDPKNIDLVKKLGQSITEAQNQPPLEVGGVFGLLRALKDPDRQKSLGLVMNILKQLGKNL
ncbi:DUF1641 domain-containing protein [Portibacter lacus]|uniref:DUF1641 domain-containing protein n=1 Tax=Portibacter lacus TaxID=1099794 RepID=A0AA37WFJ0_9BACT|nr:DUF1641 domain-containing protein [Portibacter lacus]GLR17684.1 hypothetical protein GCM10007940_22990 [Portibacter lacus]